MADIKALFEQAQELEEQAKKKAEELKKLKNEKREISFNNLANILYPFVKENIEPVHTLYVKVLERNNVTFRSWYNQVKMFSKKIGDYNELELELTRGQYNLMLYEHCSWAHSWIFGYGEKTNSYYLSDYEKRKNAIPIEWFDLVGTVEQVQELCNELKSVAELECERLITMLESENSTLALKVEEIKEELSKASSIEVSKEDNSVKMVFGGKEYKCIPVEK